MLNNDKNKEIRIHDFHRVSDGIGNKINIERGPHGFVEIYEIDENENKKLIGKSNIVTYMGREWLLTRALNYDNANITSSRNEFITWAGFGSGGIFNNDPFDPIPPTNEDESLAHDVMVNATDTNCGDYRTSPVAGYYKHPFDSIEFEIDNENSDKYLIAKITITLGFPDANNNLLNEAGLFTAASSSGGYSGNFHLYARVTFPSIVKQSSRELTFVWYLYM